MKSASKIMYAIGLVINILAVFGLAIASIVIAAFKSNAALLEQIVENDPDLTIEMVAASLNFVLIVLIIALVVELLVIVLGVLGVKKASDDNPNHITLHVLAIVFGVISGEVFYLLGGIFGIVGKNE